MRARLARMRSWRSSSAPAAGPGGSALRFRGAGEAGVASARDILPADVATGVWAGPPSLGPSSPGPGPAPSTASAFLAPLPFCEAAAGRGSERAGAGRAPGAPRPPGPLAGGSRRARAPMGGGTHRRLRVQGGTGV